jgi:hypothetical protein
VLLIVYFADTCITLVKTKGDQMPFDGIFIGKNAKKSQWVFLPFLPVKITIHYSSPKEYFRFGGSTRHNGTPRWDLGVSAKPLCQTNS